MFRLLHFLVHSPLLSFCLLENHHWKAGDSFLNPHQPPHIINHRHLRDYTNGNSIPWLMHKTNGDPLHLGIPRLQPRCNLGTAVHMASSFDWRLVSVRSSPQYNPLGSLLLSGSQGTLYPPTPPRNFSSVIPLPFNPFL